MEQFDFPGLTPAQATAVLSLASGASFSHAAQSAGIARSTLYRWLDEDPALAKAVQHAQNEYVLTLRDQLRDVGTKALAAITSILDDPQAPASVRLKAALAVLNRPHFPDQGWHLPERIQPPEREELVENLAHMKADILRLRHQEMMENSTNSTADETKSDTSEQGNAVSSPPQPIASDKVGRNELCPCGSGRKFKRCCLNRPNSPAPMQPEAEPKRKPNEPSRRVP